MKDELGGQIMKEFVGLRLKTYSCLKDNSDENKKQRLTDTKKCVRLKFDDFRNFLQAAQIENKIKH